jgi:hypothetical protein
VAVGLGLVGVEPGRQGDGAAVAAVATLLLALAFLLFLGPDRERVLRQVHVQVAVLEPGDVGANDHVVAFLGEVQPPEVPLTRLLVGADHRPRKELVDQGVHLAAKVVEDVAATAAQVGRLRLPPPGGEKHDSLLSAY